MRRTLLVALLVTWVALGLAFCAWFAYQKQRTYLTDRKEGLEEWCGERMRALRQQLLSDMGHVKEFPGLLKSLTNRSPPQSTLGGQARSCSNSSREQCLPLWRAVKGSCITNQTWAEYVVQTQSVRPWVHNALWGVVVNGSDRQQFEAVFGCRIVDALSYAPAAPRPWYLAALFQYNPTFTYPLCMDYTTAYGDTSMRARKSGHATYTNAFVLNNGDRGIAVAYPILQWPLSPNSSVDEIEASVMGLAAASIDVWAMADYMLTSVFQSKDSSTPSSSSNSLQIVEMTHASAGPIIIYGGPPPPVANRQEIPSDPSAMRDRASSVILELELEDPTRTYEVWCRCDIPPDLWQMWGSPLLFSSLLLLVVLLVSAIFVLLAVKGSKIQRELDETEAYKEKVEAMEKSKGTFLATMAHELRTPMNGMVGMIDFLLDSPLDTYQSELAQVAKDCGISLLSLLNMVLDHAKIEAKSLLVERIPLQMHAVLDSVVEMLAEQASAKKGVEFASLLDEGVPEMLLGDSTRLKQIMKHLTGNALRFTGHGHVLLRVSLLLSAGRGEAVQAAKDSLSRTHPDFLWVGKDSLGGDNPGQMHERPVAPLTPSSSPQPSSGCRCLCFGSSPAEAIISSADECGTDAMCRNGTSCAYVPSSSSSSPLSLSGLPVALDLNRWWMEMQQNDAFESLGAGTRGPEVPMVGMLGSQMRVAGAGLTCVQQQRASKVTHDLLGPRVTPRGRKLVDAGETVADDNVVIVLVVEDTGSGIPSATIPRVLHPFLEENIHEVRKQGGVGIGISLSKMLVHTLGGELGLVSRVGVGTTFVALLPMTTATLDAPSSLTPAVAASSAVLPEPTADAQFLGVPTAAAPTDVAREAEAPRALVIDGNWLRGQILSRALQCAAGLRVLVVGSKESFLHMQQNQDEGREEGWHACFVDKDAFGPLNSGLHFARELRLCLDDVSNVGTKTPQGVISAETKGPRSLRASSSGNAGSCCSLPPPPLFLVAASSSSGEGEEWEEEVEELMEDGVVANVLWKPLLCEEVRAALEGILRTDSASCPSTPTQESSVVSCSSLLTGKRVLVVDDNHVNRMVASKFLRTCGATVECVEGGREALDALAKRNCSTGSRNSMGNDNIDIVFMDLQMPGMDGYEASRKIRLLEREARAQPSAKCSSLEMHGNQNQARVLILALSADMNALTLIKCMDNGMNAAVIKPLVEEELVKALKGFL